MNDETDAINVDVDHVPMASPEPAVAAPPPGLPDPSVPLESTQFEALASARRQLNGLNKEQALKTLVRNLRGLVDDLINVGNISVEEGELGIQYQRCTILNSLVYEMPGIDPREAMRKYPPPIFRVHLENVPGQWWVECRDVRDLEHYQRAHPGTSVDLYPYYHHPNTSKTRMNEALNALDVLFSGRDEEGGVRTEVIDEVFDAWNDLRASLNQIQGENGW